MIRTIVWGATVALGVLTFVGAYFDWSLWVVLPCGLLTGLLLLHLLDLLKEAYKYFSPNPQKRLRLSNPRDWPAILKSGHFAG